MSKEAEHKALDSVLRDTMGFNPTATRHLFHGQAANDMNQQGLINSVRASAECDVRCHSLPAYDHLPFCCYNIDCFQWLHADVNVGTENHLGGQEGGDQQELLRP